MNRYRERVEKMIKFLTVAAQHSRKAERFPLPAAGRFKNRLFRYGDQCGFTLVEAMISVAIISCGFCRAIRLYCRVGEFACVIPSETEDEYSGKRDFRGDQKRSGQH